LEDENEKIQTLRRLVRELPPPNGATLALLSRHLNRVSAHSDVNKMNSKVLAIVFGPTLFRQQVETIETITNMNFQNSILEMLISKVEEIFS
jgi:hypothetical protein